MREVWYVVGITAAMLFVSWIISTGLCLPNPHSLNGNVYDNIGNIVEGVEIIITNERTNAQMDVKTNEWGEYQEDAYNFANSYQNGDTIHYYVRYKGYKLEQTANINVSKGGTKVNFAFPFCLGVVIPEGTYPSIAGVHRGTMIPSANINVSYMEIRACEGTGGHAKYVHIIGENVNSSAVWRGYNSSEFHTLIFDVPFTLEEGKMYTYEIKTGSYPQIIHQNSIKVPAGTINCTEFVDVNGKVYMVGIPSVTLGVEV